MRGKPGETGRKPTRDRSGAGQEARRESRGNGGQWPKGQMTAGGRLGPTITSMHRGNQRSSDTRPGLRTDFYVVAITIRSPRYTLDRRLSHPAALELSTAFSHGLHPRTAASTPGDPQPAGAVDRPGSRSDVRRTAPEIGSPGECPAAAWPGHATPRPQATRPAPRARPQPFGNILVVWRPSTKLAPNVNSALWAKSRPPGVPLLKFGESTSRPSMRSTTFGVT